VNDQEIRIDRYHVFRSSPVDGGLSPTAAVWDPMPLAAVDDQDFYMDEAVPPHSAGEVLYYRVNGVDDCGNASDMSAAVRLGCAFSGDVEIVSPRTGFVAVRTPVTVSVRSPRGGYAGVRITYVHSEAGEVWSYESSVAGTNWTDNGWTGWPNGNYTITATVTNDAGCAESEVMSVVSTVPQEP
jgi:hypothetical protein